MTKIEVVGHEKIQEIFKREAEQNKLSHAYLLAGPDQIGKKTIALWLTQFLFCAETDKPCGNCPACKQVANLTHPDLFLLERLPDKKTFRIEQIRTLQKSLSFKPYSAIYKVAIIDQAEFLNEESANALLKLLEEPPPYSLIFLVTHTPSKLLPTILSRVRQLRFSKLNKAQVLTFLQEQPAPSSNAESIALLCRGRIGWALEAMQNPETMPEILEYAKTFENLLFHTFHERLSIADQWLTSKKDSSLILYYLLLWWQDLLFLTLKKPEYLHFNFACFPYTASLSPEKITAYLDLLSGTIADGFYNLNKRLVWENLLIQMPSFSK